MILIRQTTGGRPLQQKPQISLIPKWQRRSIRTEVQLRKHHQGAYSHYGDGNKVVSRMGANLMSSMIHTNRARKQAFRKSFSRIDLPSTLFPFKYAIILAG